jgi:lipopolysaccharide cholinephosphotransferase
METTPYIPSDKLRKHQLHVLEMLKYFDSVCKKHQIPYFLVGGTALGAVRHKGFIPWDDDIDVAVPRFEYEKLEKIMARETHNLFKFESAEGHSFPYPPFGFISTYQPLNSAGNRIPTLDVFPLDGVPESKIFRKIQYVVAEVYHLAVFKKVPKNRGRIAAAGVWLILKVVPNSLFVVLAKLFKYLMTRWPYSNSAHVANIFGMARYNKEIMPREYLGQPIMMEFEGIQFPVPAQYIMYLSHLYGEFMRLPDFKDRAPKHDDIE